MTDPPPKPQSLRLDRAVLTRVDAYAKKSRRSRNAAVNHLLEVALNHVEALAGTRSTTEDEVPQ